MENTTLWISLTNMIWLFFLSSAVKFIHKFILESNSLLKSLIPIFGDTAEITTPNQPFSGSADEKEDEEFVDRYDVSLLMEKMGLSCNPEEDVTSGEISRVFEEREPSFEELRAAFDVFDENRDGFIDAFELRRVIQILGLGKGFDLGECRRMIRVFDGDGDGRIDTDEFIGLMRRTLC